MEMKYVLLIIIFLIFTLGSADIDVTQFGTKADGKSDDSGALTKAWNSACNFDDSTTLHVPTENYLLYLTTSGGPGKSPKITINLEGNVFEKVEGLEINGGVLDGKGARYWRCKEDDGDCPIGAKSLVFNKCKNVRINNLTSMSLTDGLGHIVDGSSDVLITDASLQTGDDCISIGLRSDWWARTWHQVLVIRHDIFKKLYKIPKNKGFVCNVLLIFFFLIILANGKYFDHNIKISGEMYKNIIETSTTKVDINFNCSASSPCKNIELQDVDLTYNGKKAQASYWVYVASKGFMSACKNEMI
ncbi:hypothetical protein AMTRI_Chr10g228840 [Amborella trichopoda]